MALIECKECGKEISDTAPSCPNCGAVNSSMAPINTNIEVDNQKESWSFAIIIAIIAIAICSYLVYDKFFTQDPDLKCDSEPAKSLIGDIFKERDLMILDLGDFKTIESTKEKSECTARFKGFMTGYFDMKYQIYKEKENDIGEKVLGLKIIYVKEAQ